MTELIPERDLRRIASEMLNNSRLLLPQMRLGLYFFGAIVFVMILTSCAMEPNTWYRAGASDKDFEHDRSMCEGTVLSTGTTGLAANTYSFEGCMEQKGWTVLEPSS